MDDATPECRAELQRLLEAASPAPWRVRGDDVADSDGVIVAECGWDALKNEAKANRALIAAMRNALPSLLAKAAEMDKVRDAEASARPLVHLAFIVIVFAGWFVG